MPPFAPPLALASLSGEADASWAVAGSEYAGAAFMGGLSLDEPTREAARAMVDRDRSEFLPEDPVAFVDAELDRLATEAPELTPAVNLRAVEAAPLRAAAAVCADHDAVCELNAHCRQDEMCAAGAGEALLTDPERLAEQVSTAAAAGATVSVKVRTEVSGVDLPALARRLEDAGAALLHVDAMDSEPMVGGVAAAVDKATVIANNGVRDRETTWEYLAYGADAVSVGRPSDDPAVLARIREALDAWDWERGRPDPAAVAGARP
jgi:TIM-barrel protein